MATHRQMGRVGRVGLLGLMGLFVCASPSLAQSSDARNEAVTMNGCIARKVAPQDPLTFKDTGTGFKYRVTGRNLGRYAGQRVEIVGSSPVPKRLVIRGGLFPSPNVAAQAGDMDPAKAAIARQPGGPESGTGREEPLPEFRVTRVRVMDGACE